MCKNQKCSNDEAENLTIRPAKKYDEIAKDEVDLKSTAGKVDVNIEPDVVLSETFIA
jgi:hypothetical protein